MRLIDTENPISTPNKISENRLIIENYFQPFIENSTKVSYILISDGENNTISKVINTIITTILSAIEIEEYPQIISKNNFNIPLQNGILKVKISSELSESRDIISEVVFEGDFVFMEEFRTNFLNAIRNDGTKTFKKKYCVKDEVSDLICNIAYPMVRELENELREYLLRFFTNKFGQKWWEISKTAQLDGKVNERDRTFKGLLDMQLYSIDFIDLKELLEGKSRVENSEIIEALDFLNSNRSDNVKFNRKIENLKNKLKGNWEKFFEEKITVSNFIKMWEDLYAIRCDIAHNCFMNFKKFNRLIFCYKIIKEQLRKLLDELRLVKTMEYEVLEKILKINLSFSKEDIESLINYDTLYLTPQNFSKESLSIIEFDGLFNEIKGELKIFGEIEKFDYQFNLADDEEFPENNVQIHSITKTILFSSITNEIKKVLQVGIEDNKFT